MHTNRCNGDNNGEICVRNEQMERFSWAARAALRTGLLMPFRFLVFASAAATIYIRPTGVYLLCMHSVRHREQTQQTEIEA